jgi:hypothetical protein
VIFVKGRASFSRTGPAVSRDVEPVEKAINWRIFYAKFKLLP